MVTMFQTNHDDSSDYDDYYDYDDYEYNYKQRHAQGLCPCSGGNGQYGQYGQYVQNKECTNYQCYGYNCVGVRVEPDGRVLSAPFGFGEKEYEIGPDFGDNYAIDHPAEFEGVILKERYIPEEIFENYNVDYDEEESNSASTPTDEDIDSSLDGYDSV